MKKNKMMRTAAVLGVAALLTTSALSGTLAKYTTTAEGGDSARVAKWGIIMGNDGKSTFSDTYSTDDKDTVKSSEDNKDVIAPGTAGSATYIVSGKPETAYEITFAGSATKDVYLKSGLKYEYAATTDGKKDATYENDMSGTVSADYYPVNYSVKITGPDTGAEIGKVAEGDNNAACIDKLDEVKTFGTLEEAMAALSKTKVTYSSPNTEANLTVTFSWAWAFDESDREGIAVGTGNKTTSDDTYDTVLGDIIAKNKDLTLSYGDSSTTLKGDNITDKVENEYDTNIGYTLTMTATQID